MKATQGTTYRMLGSRLNEASTKLEELRTIGATGKKLNKPSDDPASIRPVLNTRKQISNVDRYLETMGKSLDTMQSTDGHLNQVENIMQRAKEIMTNAVNGTLSDADRTTLAEEMSLLRKELLDTANGEVDGKYLFAGYATDTKPFVENSTFDVANFDYLDPTTWPATYQGDGNATSLEINTGELIEVNLTGNDLFFGADTWTSTTGTQQPDSGRYNLLNELAQAEKVIRANDTAGMQSSIDSLEGAAEQNRRLRSQLGNRSDRVETAMEYEEGVRIDLKQILSRYEDADAIEAFNAIVQQETAFQAALNVTSKVSQLSILDYI
jgi:flagellar hook-associated protein 3 FlgL